MVKNIFVFENNSFARFVPLLVGFMIFLATIFIVGGKFEQTSAIGGVTA